MIGPNFAYLVAHVFPAYNVELDEQACRRKYQQQTATPDAGDGAAKEKQAPADPKDATDREKAAYEYCVQRRAAKAAERQAEYAWWGVALSIVGLGLLFGTLVYTADAASAAAKSADATAASLIASQRAWMRRDQVSIGNGLFVVPNSGAQLGVTFHITNVGNTPARDITMHVAMFSVVDGRLPIAQAEKFFDEVRSKQKGHGFTLFPKESYPNDRSPRVVLICTVSKNDVEWSLKNARGQMALYVAACIDYTFPSDMKKRHQTSCLLKLEMVDYGAVDITAGTIGMEMLMLKETGMGMDHAD